MAAEALTAGPAKARARATARAGAGALVALAGVTALAALLRVWGFGHVPGNPFYDAAARSMTVSWHDFWFGAFEPGGQVSIDKTPVDLWLQVAGVELFGFNGVAVRLPELLAGVAAVPLLYDLVRRLFGRTAGLAAAAVLAVLPTAILTAHSDTMDSVMMLLDVLAAWLVVVAAQSRRVWPVVAAGAVLGLAFEVKLFEALVVAPALVVLALLAVDLPARRRAMAFAGGAAAFAVVGLSWVATASLTPLSGRPWPIGSTNGGIWNVVFVFNGLDRLQGPATRAALAIDPPGPLRLLHGNGHAYAATIGTTLLAAVVLGVVGAAAALAWRPRGGRLPRLPVAGAAFLATWLVLGVALVSHMQRLQPRYLESVTPAIAAVAGAGLAALVAGARDGRRGGVAALVAALTACAAGGIALAGAPAWAAVLAGAASAGCAVAAVARTWPRRGTAVAGLALVAVLAVPASGAVTVARQHRSDAGFPLRTDPARLAALSRFLISHQQGARYEVASPTVLRASPLIVRDARPVLMLTSYANRPLLSAARLRHAVAAGEVRYALLRPSSCRTRRCSVVVRWAHRHAVDVSAAAGQQPGTVARLTLRAATR